MHSTPTTYLTTDCSRHHHVMEQQQMWRCRRGQKRSVLNLHVAEHAWTKNNSSHFHLPDWSCPFVRQQWMTSWGTVDTDGKCPCQTVLCQESLESISQNKQNNSYFKKDFWVVQVNFNAQTKGFRLKSVTVVNRSGRCERVWGLVESGHSDPFQLAIVRYLTSRGNIM